MCLASVSGEQQRFWGQVVAWFRSLLASDPSAPVEQQQGPVLQVPVPVVETEHDGRFNVWSIVLLLGAALAVALAGWWRGRSMTPQTRIPPATWGPLDGRASHQVSGPLEFAAQVARRVPEAKQPALSSVVLYLEDSFGKNKLDQESLGRFQRETREAVRLLRRSSAPRRSRRARKMPSVSASKARTGRRA